MPQYDRTLNLFDVWIDDTKNYQNIAVISSDQMLLWDETS